MAVFHVSISKAALALVKAGKATISSGGVRALNGEMIEMFVPVVKDGIQSIVSVISPLNLMSSVAGNVQNYFIKKDTTEIKGDVKNLLSDTIEIKDYVKEILSDVKDMEKDVGQILEGVDNLKGAMQTMGQSLEMIETLSWISVGASVLNCGISVVGFAIVCNKLDNMSKHLAIIEEHVKKLDRKADTERLEKGDIYAENLKMYLKLLAELCNVEELTMDLEHIIMKFLNELKGYLSLLYKFMMLGDMDEVIVLPVLMPLTIAFEKLVKEFSIMYHYKHGEMPVNFTSWCQQIKVLQSEDFYQKLRVYVYWNGSSYSEKELCTLLGSIKIDMLQGPMKELESSIAFAGCLEQHEYFDFIHNFDKQVREKIANGQYEETGPIFFNTV